MPRGTRANKRICNLRGDVAYHCVQLLNWIDLVVLARCNKELHGLASKRLAKAKLAFLVQERRCIARPPSTYTNDVVLNNRQVMLASRLYFGNYNSNFGWNSDDSELHIMWVPDCDTAPVTSLMNISYHDLVLFYVSYVDTIDDAVATQYNYRVTQFFTNKDTYNIYYQARVARVRQLRKVKVISIWRLKSGTDAMLWQ